MKPGRGLLFPPRERRTTATRAVVLLLAALALSAVRPAAAAMITIDFENLPSLPLQPDNFNTAGAMQTYSQAGVFSISGGVALGVPSLLASFPAQGSLPNLYGTTDVADPSLLETITLTFPSAEGVTAVTGVLFNGQPVPESYEVDALSGGSTVDSQMFSNMAESFSSAGFGDFSLGSTAALPITSVTITTPNARVNG